MGKGGSKAPPPPDPAATARAQAAANREAVEASARVNAVDLYTPQGSITYKRNAHGIPVRQITKLTPDGQAYLDKQNYLANFLGQRAIDTASHIPTNPFTLDGIPNAPGSGDFVQSANKVGDAVYDRYMSRLRPEFDRQGEALQAQLANQGLPMGSEAYTAEMDRFEDNRADAMAQAARDADLARGAEQTRLFQLAQGERNQAIREREMVRDRPFNEVAAYLQGSPALGGQSAPGLPSYQVAAPDVMGLVQNNYQQRLNQWQQSQQNRGSALGGLFGLGASIVTMNPWLGASSAASMFGGR